MLKTIFSLLAVIALSGIAVAQPVNSCAEKANILTYLYYPTRGRTVQIAEDDNTHATMLLLKFHRGNDAYNTDSARSTIDDLLDIAEEFVLDGIPESIDSVHADFPVFDPLRSAYSLTKGRSDKPLSIQEKIDKLKRILYVPTRINLLPHEKDSCYYVEVTVFAEDKQLNMSIPSLMDYAQHVGCTLARYAFRSSYKNYPMYILRVIGDGNILLDRRTILAETLARYYSLQ